jgi:hypothetical protein
MRVPNFSGVGQQIQKALNISLVLILSSSSLAVSGPLFLSQKAFAASVSVCQTGCDYSTVQAAIAGAQAGDIITLADGTYALTSTLTIDKSLTLEGASEAGTIIDATGVTSGYGVHTNVDNVTIENLTINGPANSSGYGLKIEGSTNVNIANVAVSGSYRTGIDLNGVNNAQLDNVTSTGVLHGNGVALTDSRDVSIDSVSVNNDAWGGIALYATGTYYPCGVDNFSLSGTNNFGNELFPLYTGIDNPANSACTVTNLTIPSSDLPYKVTLPTGDPQDIYFTDLTSAGIIAGSLGVRSTSDNSIWVAPGQTVQDAVNSAVAGDTINVPAGTYNETVSVNKAVTILGAQAGTAAADTSTGTPRSGSESVVSKLLITAGNVDVDGFSFSNSDASGQVQVLSATTLAGINIKNNIFSGYDNVALPTNGAGNIVIENNYFANPSSSAEAVQIKTSGNSGDCSGTQVLNNVFTEATTNGAADINLSCTGSNSANVTVSGNKSSNATDPNGPNMIAVSGITGGISITGNTASTSGSQVLFFGSLSGTALITGNNFTGGGGSAVSIHGGDNYIGVNDSANSGTFTITGNTFVNNTFGIRVAAGALTGAGSVNATLNYWGDGVDPGTLVSSNVGYAPYFTNSAMTTRSDAKVLPDSSGNATANSTTPQVVVTGSSQPISVMVTAGTSNASVDYSALVSGNSGTIPQTTISSSTANVSIPAATTVTATGGSWDGVISAPSVQPNSSVTIPTPTGTTTTIATAIEVGAGNISLSFNKAVRLLLPGQAGKLVGFVRNGDFTQISTLCSADDQATGDALAAGGDCYINVGADLVVWTKHFTTFVAYSQAAQPSTPSNTSSGSSSQTSNPSSTVKTASSNSTSSSNGPSGEVLGASTTTPSTTTPTSTLSTKSTQPSNALAFEPPAKSTKKILGIAWYFWLLVIAALAVAGYLSYSYRSLDRD